MMIPVDSKVLSEILDAKTPFADDAEEAACRRLVEALTPEQVDAAANTSYAFWSYHKQKVQRLYSDQQPESDHNNITPTPSEEENDQLRIKFAMKAARRHYVGEKHDFDKALSALTETMDFRIEKRIDLLRQIGDVSAFIEADDKEREVLERYRGYVKEELARQLTVVGGHDRSNKAVVVRWGRTTSDYDDEGYMMGTIYTCERAVAATEYRSRGKEEKVVAFMDLADYDSSNSPPTSLFRTMGYQLQRYYPERNDGIVMFDPPFWLRALYKIISAFLDPVTRNKVTVISGQTAKETTLKEKIDVENALPVLLDDGSLSFGMDVNKYISEVAFHSIPGLKD